MSDDFSVLNAVARGWGWKIGTPVALIARNAFGNVIVQTECGKIFRIIPEDLGCVQIADSVEELKRTMSTAEFQLDWEMQLLVEKSRASLGDLREGE